MSEAKKIIVIGPAHPLRGGLASFNERLTRQFNNEGYNASITTFSLQYPNFLFPGTTQYSSEPAPNDLNIDVSINSVNPFNWIKIGNKIKKIKPDIIIVRYWLPFMAPCLGTILRIVKQNKHTKIICIADNVIAHEPKFYDNFCTTFFVKCIDGFVTMSEKVSTDLRQFTTKQAIKVIHPLYDNFGAAIPQLQAQQHIQINTNKKTILFFGFIRQYKGLDLLIDAIALLKKDAPVFFATIQVVIAGEYYEDANKYQQQIQTLQLQDVIIEKTNFIPDSEVKYYLCSADVVIQPYKNATQSGVTPLAYHFEKPMIVTNVGALASNVPHGKVGVVCEPNAASIANAIQLFFGFDKDFLIQNLQNEKKKYSWEILTKTIFKLANEAD
jgi:glycosyltransferase involved in cell wall biosynthesis